MFSLKRRREDDEQNSSGGRSKRSPAELRITKDIHEVSLPDSCELKFADPDDLMNFKLVISPDEGYYRGGHFTFTFTISKMYPFEAPKVKCLTPPYHPNIDIDGNVCVNILRRDWTPVLDINAIIYGLLHLFLEPTPDDPLCVEVADLLRNRPWVFANNVRVAMRGGYVGNVKYVNTLEAQRDSNSEEERREDPLHGDHSDSSDESDDS